MRKLVTVRQVEDLIPIKGADLIELAKVDGWQCIVKKGEFSVGDYGIYYEIDSALPASDPRYDFLAKKGTKKLKVDGLTRDVVRVKTMKMRGELSQGLLLPIDQFSSDMEEFSSLTPKMMCEFEVDLTKILNVVKYEKPLPSSTRGFKPEGNFPSFIKKTDQNRVQNIFKKLPNDDTEFMATLKLHGSSATIAYVSDKQYLNEKNEVDDHGGQFYVCSRNLALKDEDECIWWTGARNSNLLNLIKNHHIKTTENLAIQGELVGPGINGNYENFSEFTIMVFAIWDIDSQEYLPYDEFVDKCEELGINKEMRCPEIGRYSLSDFSSVEDYLQFAEGVKSPFCDVPEGVVFHSTSLPYQSFKAISNSYLLRGGD